MVLAEISLLWAGFVLDAVCVKESSPFMGTADETFAPSKL